MTRLTLTALAGIVLVLGFDRLAGAHCEVPCGIYGDQMRFEGMLEDHTTIEKAMAQIAALTKKGDGAQSANQGVRWIMNKESHATKIQTTIAQYFMAQRLKPAAEGSDGWAAYVSKLTKAHAVMRQAMKCKQTTDLADAGALRQAILDFHKSYEGKK